MTRANVRSMLVWLAWLAIVATCMAIVACDRRAPTDDVHRMALPEAPPDLPEGPGRNLFIGSCQTCHSARYVADQPPFSRKAWTATVDKMIKTYGAEIDAQTASAIVDYLVATHGQKD